MSAYRTFCLGCKRFVKNTNYNLQKDLCESCVERSERMVKYA